MSNPGKKIRVNILFHSNQISERGTEVALFDYALGNQNILGNRSYIAVPKGKILDVPAFEKFKIFFEVLVYESYEELNLFIKKRNIHLFYKIAFGNRETIPISSVPVFVHCVFTTKEKYGDYYVAISECLNSWFRTKYPVLPHIVKKFPGASKSLRAELHIPEAATVFGGYGGESSFNISFVKDTICDIAKKRKDLYFIFLNFKPFTPPSENIENIIFLPGNSSRRYKEIFINTCDAMIHARNDGETFGLAVAEFSVKNKPVITWAPDFIHNFTFCLKELSRYIRGKAPVYFKSHLYYLGKRAVKYTNSRDLSDIFLNFKTKYLKQVNYDCYSERFNEKNIMQKFHEIIQSLPEN
jgi:hypothetical protein